MLKTVEKNDDMYARARRRMVDTQIVQRGIRDRRVIEAMLTVPRHLFVEEGLRDQAYNDYPLPIGERQTISQPYIVALMTEALTLSGVEKVLEIGTGSGYQTTVLSLLAGRVCSVERIPALASRARKILDGLDCSNVVIKIGDGTLGWAEEAPFDAIVVTAASPDVPETYIEQLTPGGRLIIPVGGVYEQVLTRITKTERGIRRENMGGCRFVRLVGKYGWVSE